MTQLDLFAAPPVAEDEAPFVSRIPFADCRVPAAGVPDFISRYYRGDRLQGYEIGCPGYVAAVIASHERDYATQGYTIISRHESTTGCPVAWPMLNTEGSEVSE